LSEWRLKVPENKSNKKALGSYTTYLCELRWLLIHRDSIVEDHLINDLRHYAFRTYFQPSEDIRVILGTLSVNELIKIAFLELRYLADLSDHGTVSVPAVLNTWLELNGPWFIKAFASLCEEKPSWRLDELQEALELALEPHDAVASAS